MNTAHNGTRVGRSYAGWALLPLKDGSDYGLPVDFLAELNQTYYDVARHLQDMRLWCLANPEKRKTKRGARRFVLNWIKRSGVRRPMLPVADPLPIDRTRSKPPEQWREMVGRLVRGGK